MPAAVGRSSANGRADSPGRDLPPPGGGAGSPVDPATPRPLAAAAAAAFGALSRLRGARVFHPVGVGYRGWLHVEPRRPGATGVALLDRPGRHPALLRLSRAAGLPEPLPDVLGLALRLTDVHGPGRHQDFLLVTSADAPVAHHLLLPGLRGFLGQSYSSLLLYRVGAHLRLVGAVPAAEAGDGPARTLADLAETARRGGLGFRLALAAPLGRWEAVADIEVGERLDDEQTERLAFTPWSTGGGIRPVGPLMGLRRASYAASQRGRGLRGSEIP